EQKPNLAGYVVERAFLYAGPYEALAAQALPPTTAQYEDATVRGGTTYYYRVRIVNSRGDLGNPSSAAAAQPQNPGAPPKVDGLAADIGQTRVRLTWKPVVFPVAGYFVERRAVTGAAGVETWVRLNARVTPEPLYDDYLGLASDAKMEYRVLAVAFDNAEGPVSASVQVAIADRSIPEAPSITGSSGADGKALVNFVPALPAERTAQILVLRSGREADLGVVVGDPLSGDARQFTDLYVSPGERYWYRLVAVDKNGNRSDPTRPVAIRVGSPQIPTPAAPTAQFAGTPYPHVVLQFQPPPAGLSLIVERQAQTGNDSGWIRIAGPTKAQTATDNNVPASGSVGYRISYVAADGQVGPASSVVTISNPGI
ncbi:MAG: fibronectin type III domain-containing protein, partial [Terriglobales bacterium]